LIREFPERPITIWNVLDSTGLPSLMLTCADCLAILMGYGGDLSDVPSYELIPMGSSPLDDFVCD
jgi:hypothetical protein